MYTGQYISRSVYLEYDQYSGLSAYVGQENFEVYTTQCTVHVYIVQCIRRSIYLVYAQYSGLSAYV